MGRTKKKMSAETHTAFHEAGHAAMSVILCGKTGKVTIVPDPARYTAGSARTASAKELLLNIEGAVVSRSDAWILGNSIKQMVILLAGETAARRASGQRDGVGPGVDYERVAEYALTMARGDSKEANALIAWLERRTEGLVKDNWKPIKVVAAALLRDKTLTGKQVMEIILSTPP